MRHEPSDSCLPVQPAGDRRCPACRAVRPCEDFPTSADTPAGCASCRRRRATADRRRQQRALRLFTRQAEAGYRALLAHHRGGGGDAA